MYNTIHVLAHLLALIKELTTLGLICIHVMNNYCQQNFRYRPIGFNINREANFRFIMHRAENSTLYIFYKYTI